MNIVCAPIASASPSTALIAASEECTAGTTTHGAQWNRSASAAAGPTSVLPAIGCPPTKPACSGRNSAAHLITSALVEPVSVITVLGPTAGAISSSRRRMPRIGAARTTRSAPSTACGGGGAARAALLRLPRDIRVAVEAHHLDAARGGVTPQAQADRGADESGAENR